MNLATVRTRQQVSRPLKVLVPLIQEELDAGNEAGLEHYRQAGEMLIEAKEQLPRGSWSRWLTHNFELSQRQAQNYMRLARMAEEGDPKYERAYAIEDALGKKPRREYDIPWNKIRDATSRVNVARLANERQSRDQEIKLHRDLALQLIDLGYRALATRLHPDTRSGSKEAMARLNVVRDELKSIAATRRFI